jgi:hypothetical protein
MWSPQELIGQKVWLALEPEQTYGELQLLSEDTPRVQAELLQPTSPPWFYARYLNPPITVKAPGQWLSLHQAQQAVLLNPVIEPYEDDDLDFLPQDYSDEEYDSALDLPVSDEYEPFSDDWSERAWQDRLQKSRRGRPSNN